MIDARIDAYIDKSADFARPILVEIRARIHKACPEAVETMKWSFPHFMYKDKILCGMAAFKAHCSLGVWGGGDGKPAKEADGGMGHYGKMTSMADLPGIRELTKTLKAAMLKIDEGAPRRVNAKPAVRYDAATMVAPDDLATAIRKNRVAQKTWDGFSYSARKDYVEWITEAKRAETREKRVVQAVEWMAEGKKRHWKYENC